MWNGPRTVPSVEWGGLGWLIESIRRERPRMSERRMNSCSSTKMTDWFRVWLACVSHVKISIYLSMHMITNLSNIRTYLPHLRQELNSLHPFLRTKSRLARKVMHMRDEPFQDIAGSSIRALRVDLDGVLGDVFDGEVF